MKTRILPLFGALALSFMTSMGTGARAACPANYCAEALRSCKTGCPCATFICNPVSCTSDCSCPIFCP